ncbi:chitobiase/beta-hexosaminidase C-terminal domain-containing protein [Patescibacteria group bacterium]|nr:chitobiase/beta-hexosaminidase C-terminal domain-containing protein [Patescibacteria group bacterium]
MRKLTVLKIFIFLVFFFLFLSYLPINILASTKTFQDNFNDGNYDGWVVLRNPCYYNGAPAKWEVVNGKLGIKINGGSCVTEIMPDDTLWNNLGDDYSVQFDMTLGNGTTNEAVGGTDHNFAFRYRDSGHWYDIHLQSPNVLGLQRISDTGMYTNNSVLGNFKNGQTIHFKIEVTKEHIQIFAGTPPQLLLDFSDPGLGKQSSGRIALQASAGGNPVSETWFDNVVVTAIEPPLNVPLLKQTDPIWGGKEYDTASSWVNAPNITIGDWGCALTSTVMVLNYYGINKLTDGTGLDPGSLNTWLKSQPDGYIGSGFLNWLAISRLSYLAKPQNPAFSHDGLEYRKVNTEDKTQLTTDITNQQPDILEEPGHFIVAKGIDGDTFDINDPYYDRTLLNDYGNTFSSLGRYIASDTNLSYIMLTVDPNVQLLLTDPSSKESGNDTTATFSQIPNASYYVQSGIVNPINGDTSPPSRIFLLPTPEDGSYSISIATASATPQNFALKIYEYNTLGEPTISSFSAVAKKDKPGSYQFIYSQGAPNQEEPLDNTKPKIISAKTLDTNGNGKIDVIQATFSKDLYGPSVTKNDFQIDGYSVTSVKEENGLVTINLLESDGTDTGKTPTITMNQNSVEDFANGNWNDSQSLTSDDDAPPLAPTVNIPGDDYLAPQTVSLTDFQLPNSVSIYYTINGSDPATSSSKTLFASPIIIANDLILKAIAVDSAGNKSSILNQDYRIAPTIDISSLRTTVGSDNRSFTINWTTQQKALGRVIFDENSHAKINHLATDPFGGKFGYKNTTDEEITKTKNHSMLISGLSPERIYYYRIIARASPEQISDEQSITLPGSSTSSSPSTSPSASPPSNSSPVCNDQKPQGAPKLINAFPGLNTVTLIWSKAADPISYYLVAYGIEPNKPLYGNPNVGDENTTSFVVENLSGGQTYYFKVRAGNGCAPGDFSPEMATAPFGFREQGAATGFAKGVLGSKTQVKQANSQSNLPSPRGLGTAPSSPVLSARQQTFVKIAALLILLGFSASLYLKRKIRLIKN